MNTWTKLGLAGVAAASLAGHTTADVVDFSLQFSAGGQQATFPFTFDGSISDLKIGFDFTGDDAQTWAGDVVIALTDPNGNQAEYGGFDTGFGYTVVGDFPAEFDVETSGSYETVADFSSAGLSGSGTWTLEVMNGYTGSTNCDWVGSIDTDGCPDCPDADCNGNGVEDADDISGGTSEDCDTNGVPDECQADCNGNGSPDACDTEECVGYAFELISAAGGDIVAEVPFQQSGELTTYTIDVTYGGATAGEEWCGDLLVGIQDAAGTILWQAGGYNLAFDPALPLEAWPAEWNVGDAGEYTASFSFNVSGEAGEHKFLFGNGWDGSGGGTWTGTVSTDACTDCIIDCNNNGVADADDISSGTSEDCNANNRPDECDIADGGDSNGDDVLDACQIECGDAASYTVNGIGTYEESFTVEFAGPVTAFNAGVLFTAGTDQTWAGDVLIGVTSPNGQSVEFGGYDHTFGYETIGDFSADYDVIDSGAYAPEDFVSPTALTGEGTWTIQIANGFVASTGSEWTVDLTLCSLGGDGGGGCDDDPDLDGNGCVNGADVGLLLTVWNNPNASFGDLNCDGNVDGADFGIVLSGWQQCP
jgi:hypothetical protein